MTTQRKRVRALAGAVLAAALAAGGVVATTAPAHAFTEALNPDNEIKGATITVTPEARNGPSGGTPAVGYGPDQIKISQGCPEGFRQSSRTLVVSPADEVSAGGVRRTNTSAELWGLQGNPITLTGEYAGAWSSLTAEQLPSGYNRVIVTCDPVSSRNSEPIGDAKYFLFTVLVDREADTWQVVPNQTGPVLTATTTTAGATGVTQTSATLTAAVTPADAAGTVQFSVNGAPQGSPVAVTGGAASLPVSGLAAGTTYQVSAAFTPADAAVHEASTGTYQLTTEAQPSQDSSTSGVTVTVPGVTDPGTPKGLKLQTKPNESIPLTGGARQQGAAWNAEGDLGTVVVNDDRRNAEGQGWTLSGQANGFTGSGTAAGQSIAASALSWTGATGGTGFAAGSLDTPKVLSTGTASADADKLTTISGAKLQLVVPAGQVAGDYAATVTLTLI